MNMQCERMPCVLCSKISFELKWHPTKVILVNSLFLIQDQKLCYNCRPIMNVVNITCINILVGLKAYLVELAFLDHALFHLAY